MFFYNLRSLRRHWRRQAIVVLILAVATATFVLLSSILESFSLLVRSSAEQDNVAVLARGGLGERWPELSHVGVSELPKLRALNGIAKRADGEALLSPEYIYTAEIGHGGVHAHVTVRGVSERAFDVHQSVQGELPRGGIVLGAAVRRLFRDLRVGDTLAIAGRTWQVIGFFSPRGGQTQYDSEIWAPLDELLHARNVDAFSLVAIKAESPGLVPRLIGDINDDKSLMDVRAVPELALNTGAEAAVTAFRTIHATFSALLMVVAGVATLNILLHNVFRRRRDMAILRALGSSPWEVATGFLFEGLVLALGGAVIGALLSLALTDSTILTGSLNRTGVVIVRLRFATSTIAGSILTGVLVGFACTLVPAWYCARFVVKNELRAE